MTNKNKKIKKLVKATDADHAVEFELIPTLTQAVSGPSPHAETSNDTFDVDESPVDLDDQTHTELKQLVCTRNDQISDLEYQLEDSRIRQRGLDEEIKVREEITTDINREIREARKQLMDAADELETLNQRYLQTRAQFNEAESEAASLRSSLDLQGKGDTEKDQRIAELEGVAAKTAAELADLRNYVEGRKAIWHQRDAENAVLQAEMEQLRDGIRELESMSVTAATGSQTDSGDESDLPANHGSEIDKLRKDNERFESYANELRIKLQDQMAATSESVSMRHKLEANLEVASRMINELTADLEREKATRRELTGACEALKTEFENETRQIRFELGVAEQTIADQDTVNQQLASDLIDNQGFRQALETHVGDMEKDTTRTIEKLEKDLAEAIVTTEEYEQKLRVKDGAIADLMKELADQSSKLNFTGELESALQKIDGHRPNGRTGTAGKSERVTRQLIGSADGKDLRFPLFRKRLSIGRTTHNDIQLDLKFVSRRHAVIASDEQATRIIDWGSRNGVYVNKKRITEKILKSGDVITIGLTNLRYEERVKR
ncbi:MAG: FHA domain-containing protein [Woeseiaceae bacterium]